MTNQRRICLTLEANGWVSNVITNYGSRSKGYQHPRGGSVIATALVLAARHKRLVTQLSRGDISTTTSPSCVTTNT